VATVVVMTTASTLLAVVLTLRSLGAFWPVVMWPVDRLESCCWTVFGTGVLLPLAAALASTTRHPRLGPLESDV